jgi:hypothetical protein
MCASCGVQPDELEAKYTAGVGKTHWRRIYHGEGIPGRRGGAANARKCGPWVERTATREQREEAVRAWKETTG